jgi:O-antigen ligase
VRATIAAVKATSTWTVAAIVMAVVIAAAFAIGFVGAADIRIGLAVGLGLVPLIGVLAAPFPIALKFFTLYAVFNFVQMPFGELRLTGIRGASVGTIFLSMGLFLWLVNYVARGNRTRRTIWDFWGPLALVIIPACTVIYTASFDTVPGYSLLGRLMYVKNAAIPFFLTYLTTQLIQDRKELRLYFLVLVIVCALATVGSLPLALRNVGEMEGWQGSRTAGLLDSGINQWACMINEITAYYFLLLAVVFRDRLGTRLLLLGIIGGFALSLVATMSRQGLLGFGFALFLAWSMSRLAKGRIPWVMAGVLAICGTAGLLQLAPDLVDGFHERVSTERIDESLGNRSHTLGDYLNQYSGDRFELWRCAVMVWLENPIFGRGYGCAPERIAAYHRTGMSNSPHNLFTGALAQGGIIYLTALLVLFWTTLRLFYRGFRSSLKRSDLYGVAICGGGAVGLACFLLNGMTMDVLLVNERSYVLGFFWGVAGSYAMSLEDEDKADALRARATSSRTPGPFPARVGS